eukprot:TRINITY_DN1264_c4_g1_i1.p2 TRINITY_DN1264_c4_g1~~TRINITY_DN1264_c4_g1_i1.p2  ORF type:complete len:152 (+),score=51.04 TRINITY_DN1264_c4_g1_i1:71-526(+)
MSVLTLHVALASGFVSVEVAGAEKVDLLYEKIASEAKLDSGTFTILYEGEALERESCVGEHPFEDGSLLQAVLSKEQAMLRKLREHGVKDTEGVNTFPGILLLLRKKLEELELEKYFSELWGEDPSARSSFNSNVALVNSLIEETEAMAAS